MKKAQRKKVIFITIIIALLVLFVFSQSDDLKRTAGVCLQESTSSNTCEMLKNSGDLPSTFVCECEEFYCSDGAGEYLDCRQGSFVWMKVRWTEQSAYVSGFSHPITTVQSGTYLDVQIQDIETGERTLVAKDTYDDNLDRSFDVEFDELYPFIKGKDYKIIFTSVQCPDIEDNCGTNAFRFAASSDRASLGISSRHYESREMFKIYLGSGGGHVDTNIPLFTFKKCGGLNVDESTTFDLEDRLAQDQIYLGSIFTKILLGTPGCSPADGNLITTVPNIRCNFAGEYKCFTSECDSIMKDYSDDGEGSLAFFLREDPVLEGISVTHDTTTDDDDTITDDDDDTTTGGGKQAQEEIQQQPQQLQDQQPQQLLGMKQ